MLTELRDGIYEEFIASEVFNFFVSDVNQDNLTYGSDVSKFWLSYITDVEILLQHYHSPTFGNH